MHVFKSQMDLTTHPNFIMPLQKQSRKKHDGSVHLLPQEMVEKLQSYYAGIDAFELQEEEVSENELEGIRLKR